MESEPIGHLLAVMAHSMLSSVSAIRSAASMLNERDRLTESQTETVIAVICAQSDHLHEMLKDLVRTGDPALMATLDDLGRVARADDAPPLATGPEARSPAP